MTAAEAAALIDRIAESIREDPGQFRFDITVIDERRAAGGIAIGGSAPEPIDRQPALTLDAGVTIARSRAEVDLGDLYETLKALAAAAEDPAPDEGRIAAGLERLSSLPVVPTVILDTATLALELAGLTASGGT